MDYSSEERAEPKRKSLNLQIWLLFRCWIDFPYDWIGGFFLYCLLLFFPQSNLVDLHLICSFCYLDCHALILPFSSQFVPIVCVFPQGSNPRTQMKTSTVSASLWFAQIVHHFIKSPSVFLPKGVSVCGKWRKNVGSTVHWVMKPVLLPQAVTISGSCRRYVRDLLPPADRNESEPPIT